MMRIMMQQNKVLPGKIFPYHQSYLDPVLKFTNPAKALILTRIVRCQVKKTMKILEH